MLKFTTIGPPENTKCFELTLDRGHFNPLQSGSLQTAKSARRQTANKVPAIHFSLV